MPRAVSLLPELVVVLGLAFAFGALLAGIPRAGRVARTALRVTALAGLLAAVLTRNMVDEYLFLAYRIDSFSQYAKALVFSAALLPLVAAPGFSEHDDARFGAPFFSLVATAGAVAAASAADLLLLWLVLEAVGVAFVLTAAAEGEWRARERLMEGELVRWLVPSMLMMLGIVMVGALAGTTRFTDLTDLISDVQAEPAGSAGMLMVLAALGWRAGFAPLQAARSFARGDAFGGRVALAVAVWTALAALFVRMAVVALEGWVTRAAIAFLVGALSFGVLAVAFGAWMRSGSAEPRRPVVAIASVIGLGLAAAAFAAWAFEAAGALP